MYEIPREFQMNAGEHVTITEIRQKLESLLKHESKKPDKWLEPFIVQATNKQNLKLISNEAFLNTSGGGSDVEVVAYEREPYSHFDLSKKHDDGDFFLCELRMVQEKKSYMGLLSSIQQLGYSRLHLFRRHWTVYQIK